MWKHREKEALAIYAADMQTDADKGQKEEQQVFKDKLRFIHVISYSSLSMINPAGIGIKFQSPDDDLAMWFPLTPRLNPCSPFQASCARSKQGRTNQWQDTAKGQRRTWATTCCIRNKDRKHLFMEVNCKNIRSKQERIVQDVSLITDFMKIVH